MADLSSLVVRISADVASLQSDMGKAIGIANSAGDQIGKGIGAGLDKGLDKLKEFAAQIAAAFAIEKLVEFGNQAVELGDQLNKMSQKVGISVENLSALGNAAKLSDVGLDDLGGSLTKLAKSATEAAGGSKQQVAVYEAIGVSVKDAAGNMRPMSDLLSEVAGKFASYQDSAAKTALAQELFGKSGAQLIPLLNQLGTDGFASVTKAAQDYNQVISGEQAKNSEEFHDNLTRLSSATSGVANAVVGQLLPSLVKLTDGWAEAAKTTDGYATSAGVVVSAIKSVVFVLLAAKESVVALDTVVFALGDTLGAAGDLFNGFAKGVGGDLTAIGAAMKGDFAGAKVALDGAGQSLADGWNTAKTRVQTAASAMSGGVSDAISNTKKSYDALFGTFSNVSSGAETTGKKIASLNAPIVANADASDKAAKAADQLADMLTKDAETLASLRGKLDPAAKAQEDYVKQIIQIQAAYTKEIELANTAGASLETYATIKQNVIDKTNAAQAALAKENAALAKAGDVLGAYIKQTNQQNAISAAVTDRERAIAEAVAKVTEEYDKNTDAGIKNKQSLDQIVAGATAVAGASFDLQKAGADVQDFVKQFGDVTPFEKLTKGIEEVGTALQDAMGKGATDDIKKLQQTIGGIRQSLVEGIVKSSQDGLRSLQSMTTEGSTAFKVMQVAIDALTLVQAVSAILNQAQGDPYTAFARMAAMAAAVVALGVDIGGFGGGGSPDAQSAAVVQKTQGTGTVLGDATAQSDSIAKAIDITANATTQLVGLNRGMLNALNALQAGLGSAGNILARGAGDVPAPALSGGIDIPGDPLGSKLLGGLFGGSQKIIDSGITIAGGALSDMINSIAVGAYTTIHTSGGLFGSGGDSKVVTDITDQFGKQFSLVIKSISDTVKQGAEALGLLPADVEKALAAYQVAAINISLQGLSADDQQKALEAVFSSIFDGVAAAVVPFIGQFQQVGEGLGETLVRIATEVQVTQEGFRQLGLAVSTTDPEKFAQISDALITAAGGIDDFISGMQSFVDNFSSDSNKLAVSAGAISSAFAQVGLSVPATRDGMWALMQSLDATTDAGRAQIATLLRLSDASAAYYDQIDAFNKTLGIGQESDLNAQLKAVRDASVGLIKALSATGASAQTLQKVYSASIEKEQEIIAALQESAQELAFSLGLSTQGSLDQVNQQIAALQSQAGQGATAVAGFGSAITSATDAAQAAINLLLGDLSPLNDQQKLQEAKQGLANGTVTVDQADAIAKRLYASTQQYTDFFNWAQQFAGRAGATPAANTGKGLSASDSSKLAELLKEQTALQKAADLASAQQLAGQIGQLEDAKKETLQQVLDDLGIKAVDLQKKLGLDTFDALQSYIETQKANANTTGDTTNTLLQQILDAIRGPTPARANDGTGNAILNGRGTSTGADTSRDPFVPRGQRVAARAGATP